MELFTQYNVTLFLATIALVTLVLYLTLFTGGIRQRHAIKAAMLQSGLALAGRSVEGGHQYVIVGSL